MSGGADISLIGIRKSFGPVTALAEGALSARAGEVHALLGENGAGKTTLVEILGGMLRPDGGRILLGGREVRFRSPRDAGDAGVGMVHQHFTLVPALTVLENVALGLRWDRFGLRLPLRDVVERLRAVSAETGLEVDPGATVATLSVGAQQRVEILRVLVAEPAVLVLDEPTAVLAPPEVESLFRVLRRLASAGRTVILIAHKLDEVLEVGDRFTVLRNGRTVFQSERERVTAPVLAAAMIGAERLPVEPGIRPAEVAPTRRGVVAELVGVTASNPAGGQALRGVDLSVSRGEIVGVAGVEGNGQRELARVLAGLDPPESGEVRLPTRPGWIPQDRSREGLIPELTVSENLALALHDAPGFQAGWGRMDWPAVDAETRALVKRFDVRTGPWGQRMGALSGGNSQKVVVGRELLRSRDLLIAENPTRGLDLGAAAFVHGELRRLRSGTGSGDLSSHDSPSGPAIGDPPGIVLISNDLDEVMALSDRVLVLLRGRLTLVPESDRSREIVGRMMLGMGTE